MKKAKWIFHFKVETSNEPYTAKVMEALIKGLRATGIEGGITEEA
jgi:hypothetical protein